MLRNKQSVCMMTWNLGVLLRGYRIQKENDGEVFLTTEAEVLCMISGGIVEPTVELKLNINELCAVAWEHKGKANWYLGFVLKFDQVPANVEHLIRVSPAYDEMWEYPTNYKDQQNVNIAEQILPISPLGDWDYTNDDLNLFCM